MNYEVKKATNRKIINDFLMLPFEIYRNDKNWIAPITSEIKRTLNKNKNPYFKNTSLELFICYRNNIPTSRVAIIINKVHQDKFKTKSAFFGFFEAIDDSENVRHLFDAVENYCRLNDIEVLEGPFNPNHYSELGMQIDNFNTSPTFFQTYNPAYYCKLLKLVGFKISTIFHTRANQNISKYVQQRYGNQSTQSNNGYSIRPFSMRNLNDDLEKVREIFNDAFSDNWHFLPVSKEEYRFSAKFLKLVTYPDLILIAEHQGIPVGVLQCVLDINPLLKDLNGKVTPLKYFQFIRKRKSIRKIIIYAVGIKKDYQRTKVYRLLLNYFCRTASKYECLETTWMSDKNYMAIKASEHLGLKPDKHFAIYEKRLNSGIDIRFD
jgi:hypothetical protein